jgi:cytidylate kinase
VGNCRARREEKKSQRYVTLSKGDTQQLPFFDLKPVINTENHHFNKRFCYK